MPSLRRMALSMSAAFATRIARNASAQQILFNSIRLNRPETSELLVDDDVRFLSYLASKRASSRSQLLQDLWVCFELGEKRAGYFVEFGATNGLTNSNTWLLEKELGWDGILAEPNPYWHTDLAANREAAIDRRCVWSKTGHSVTFVATNDSDPELSGIAQSSAGDHFADARNRGERIEIETVSLMDLLNAHGAPSEIDYLSIDTEGSELDILSSLDFGKYRFRLISVEANASTAPGIADLLGRNGYLAVFPHFSQWDRWYVATEWRSRPRPAIVAPLA